jgi:hypothetical protein
MRLIRHIALAAGAVALTGCGLNSTSADSSPTDTTPPATAVSTDARADASADASAPAAQDETPSTTAVPTSSSSPTESSAGTPPASSPPVVTYRDKTGLLQLPVSNASIPDAPAGLRDFAKTRLKRMWHDQFQDDPGCQGIGQLQIKRASSAAAYVEASWGALTPTCPQYAGNPDSWEIWSNSAGTWSVNLEGSGLAACADLVEHAVPRSIYPTCSNGSSKVPNPVG